MLKKIKIGLGAVNIGNWEKRYVNEVLSSNRLSYGPFIRKFESEFAALHQSRHAVFCNSGTSALQVAFHALKKKYKWPDDAEVLVPALTFVASINTVIQNKLKPVFVDIEPDFFMVDPEEIEAKITNKTVAIEVVHLFGQPAEMDPILKIAQKYNLKVIEDSCETMFARYKGKTVGSFGDISCFSTYTAHLVVTGVGGLILTNDNDLFVISQRLINHGRDGIYLHIDDDDRLDNRKLETVVEKRFKFTDIGYSYRCTEMEGALGVGQLKGWKKMISRRQENAKYLTDKLRPLSYVLQLPQIRANTDHVFMVYPIVIKDETVDINKLVFYLEEKGIETRFLLPTLTQPVYKRIFGNISSDYPVAKRVSEKGFYIGCHQDLGKRELDYMVKCFGKYFK